MVYGKDILVDPIDNPIDVSRRQTKDVATFKKDTQYAHNR